MTLHRFFVGDRVEPGVAGSLDESRSRQAVSVLRLRAGDPIVVFDGSGIEGTATVTSATKSTVTYQVNTVSTPDREPFLDVTVGLALLRGDRFEIATQKLTEIGVRKIVPLSADRCVVSFRDARDWEKRAARYQRIVIEAMEQSERVTGVELASPTPLEAFLSAQRTATLVERHAGTPIADYPISGDAAAIAIGPEGGWSERELEMIDRYADHVSLGGLILRAETAAIIAAGTLIQMHMTQTNANQEHGETQRGS